MRKWFHIGVLCLSAALLLSCSAKDSAPRLEVLSSDGTRLNKTLTVPVEGGKFTLTARSDNELDIFYGEAADASAGWFQVQEITNPAPGEYVVKCSAESLVKNKTLDLRQGTLSFSAPRAFSGCFLDVRQGYARVWRQSFASLPGGCLTLQPGDRWNSGAMTGISAIRNAYVAFEARAEMAGGSSEMLNIPLQLTLGGGATFPTISRTEYVTDVAPYESFEPACFQMIRIYNGGVVFSSETTLTLSLPAGAGATLYIDNVSIYEIPVVRDEINGEEDDDDEPEE